jgi:hypothetical protein
MSTRRTRGRAVLLTTATALTLAAIGQAATTRYQGKVKGAGPVSFRLTGSTVARFQASLSVACVSSSGGKNETYLLTPQRSAKLDKTGRFTLTYKNPKLVGGPFPLYKIDATVRGKVGKGQASGTLRVSYFKNQVVLGRIQLIACNSGTASWTAKRN